MMTGKKLATDETHYLMLANGIKLSIHKDAEKTVNVILPTTMLTLRARS